MYPVNCITKQVIGVKKAMPGRHRILFWREKLTGSVIYSLRFSFSKHLLFLCSFNSLGCLISFHTNCISLLYILGYDALSKYVICKHFFSFHRLSFHFMDGFFYYAEGFEFDVVSLVYFCSSCLCF